MPSEYFEISAAIFSIFFSFLILFALFSKRIPPAKMPRLSSPTVEHVVDTPTTAEVNHIVKCEVARLDRKFMVVFDSTTQQGSKVNKLVCSIADPCLPSVPHLHVYIPADYPTSSPTCTFLEHEINSTTFFVEVQEMFSLHLERLPSSYSISHLLDTWEMAIRHACSPNKNINGISSLGLALGV